MDQAQMDMFSNYESASEPVYVPTRQNETPVETPDPNQYDRIVVFFSGGKDSIACVLHLLECGVDPERIELHHHLVDGREGSHLMDWPVTDAYCQAFADHLGLRLFFSWKQGGFEREMNRSESRTAPIIWQSEDGSFKQSGGDAGKLGTRRKFPQVSADLRVRWCSAYLKVDVGARLLTSEPRFLEGKTLVVTGERAEESSSRAKYCTYEPNRADNRDGARIKRYIDHWRPIHKWSEEDVWKAMRRHGINAHPAYHVGFGRVSCQKCIFGSPDQWATVAFIDPEGMKRIADYEQDFGSTIHRTRSVLDQAARGIAYDADPEMVKLAMGTHYPREMLYVSSESWVLPKGAFGESTGPV